MLLADKTLATRDRYGIDTADADRLAGPDRSHVDDYFSAVHSYWRDVYKSPDLDGSIYRGRQAVVLRHVDACGLSRGTDVLEVGCGSGSLTLELARRAYTVHAIDSVAEMIDNTRDRLREAGIGSNVTIERKDVHALDLPSERYDMAVAVGVLPWLDDAPKALSELRRVLRPGGVLILTADNSFRLGRMLDPRFSPLTSAIRRVTRRALERAGVPRRRSQYPIPVYHSPREVDRLLRRCGFLTERSETTGFGPFTLLGRRLCGDASNLSIHQTLERVRAAFPSFLRWSGNHYIVTARRVPNGVTDIKKR